MKQICVNGKAKVSNEVCLAPTVWFSSCFECSVFPILLVLTFQFNIVFLIWPAFEDCRNMGRSPALVLFLASSTSHAALAYSGFSTPLPKLLPHKLVCTRIPDQRRTLSLMKWLKIKGPKPLPYLGAVSLYVPAPFTSVLLGPPLALGPGPHLTNCMSSSPLDNENYPASLSKPLRLLCHITPPSSSPSLIRKGKISVSGSLKTRKSF